MSKPKTTAQPAPTQAPPKMRYTALQAVRSRIPKLSRNRVEYRLARAGYRMWQAYIDLLKTQDDIKALSPAQVALLTTEQINLGATQLHVMGLSQVCAELETNLSNRKA